MLPITPQAITDTKITVVTAATLLYDLIDAASSVTNSQKYYTDLQCDALLIQPEDDDCRISFGSTPTATDGFLLKTSTVYYFPGIDLSKVKLIRTSGDVAVSIQLCKSSPGESFSATIAGTSSAAANVAVTSSALPTGAATAAAQTDGSQKSQLVDAGGEACTVTGGKLDVNASIDTTGLATSALQTSSEALLTTIDADTGTIASDTTSIDGKITACNTGDVTVSSSALPTGAATAALQTSSEALLTTIDADTSTLAGAVSGSEMQVDVVSTPGSGMSIYRNLDVDESGDSAVGAATTLYGYYVYNNNAATIYLKLYNKATAPTVGTDTPVMTIPIPTKGAANVEFTNGITFGTGLGVGATTGVADADTGAPDANDVIINLFYK